MESQPRHIVIIGGGVIGCTTAYFLAKHPCFNPKVHRITILEATSIAAGASGKAGGLLGLWAYPSCLVPLSYRLHTELAAAHDGAENWGYRRLECGQLTANAGPECPKLLIKPNCQSVSKPRTKSKLKPETKSSSKSGVRSKSKPQTTVTTAVKDPDQTSDGQVWQKLPKQDSAAADMLLPSAVPEDLDWIDRDLVQEYDQMGLPGYTETAQVHPYQFTKAIAELARCCGVEIKERTRVVKVVVDETTSTATGVEYVDRDSNQPGTIPNATDVVIAAGPWTGRLLPRTKVQGVRAHSVVFEANVSPYAVFTNITLPSGWIPEHRLARGEKRRHKRHVDPEFYARPNGEVYACGEPDHKAPLPETADLVECDTAQCDDMASYIGTISPKLKSSHVIAKQACYMPRHMRFGRDHGPIVGQTSISGLFVASGHSCWGIQNGPATGKVLSELIMDGEIKSADVSELDPRKYHI